ncbi:hypothetical protein [Agrobacterium rosae]|uniref:hypothetical protein n=1 Tax=Agrobacterium rosae TaxID=1972867 RepID=UPI0019D3F32E|nr:hypothetical protein [Agrobacterium rosae]
MIFTRIVSWLPLPVAMVSQRTFSRQVPIGAGGRAEPIARHPQWGAEEALHSFALDVME